MPSLHVQEWAHKAVARGVGMALAALLAMIFWSGPAKAEPYLTVREGYKCSQCHVNKSGGGARTDYAKVYLETRMSAGPGPVSMGGTAGKSSEVGFGRLNSYVSVGADLRTNFTYTDMDHATPTSQFDKPKSCEACHATTGGGKQGELYMRLEPVPDVVSIVYSTNLIPNTSMRELYAILDNVLPANGYVKAGTFRLPSGFQNTWDYPFQHVDQGGYGGGTSAGVVGLETVRAKGGVEVGFEPGALAFSMSVSNPDDTDAVQRGSRVVANAYAVTKFGVVGLTYATDPLSFKVNRNTSEVYLGTSLGRFTALGQIDTVVTKDENAGATVKEAKEQAWLGEVDFLITKGHNLRLLYEARDPDLDVSNDRRDRTSLIYEPFLTPYLQARVGYRMLQGPISTTNDTNGTQGFVELHFVF